MGNFFDQFDAPPEGFVLDQPQRNYFDQFDAPTGREPLRLTVHPNSPALPEGFVMDAPTSAGSIAADVAKSAASGAAKGVVGFPGIPGNVAALLHSAGTPVIAALLEKMYGPERAQRFSDLAANRPNPLPTSEDFTNAVGLTFQPQTTAGRYAQTLGEFLPNLIGGPESTLTKLASRVLAPGVASEAAGQATAGTALEPFARMAGAVVGGAAGARTTRPAALEPPSIGELKDASRAGYRSPEVQAVQIKPSAVSNLGDKIENDLVNAGFREKTTPKTFGVVGELDVPKGVQSVGVADLDSARRALGIIAREKDGIGAPTAEATAAGRAISHIDQFLPSLRQGDLLAGDAAQANAILREARGNWGAAKRAEMVATKLDNAELQAGSTYGGGNINNATRQAFRPLLKNNAAGATGFSPEALDALRRVVEGGFVGNTARQLGRLAPVGPVGIGMHIAGAMSPAATGTIPLAAAAYGAKKLGEAITRNEVARLSSTLRGESPLAAQRAAFAQRLAELFPRRHGAVGGTLEALLSTLPHPH